MTAPHAEQLVNEYLGRLGSSLSDVPTDRREEIVGEIKSHIAEERARMTEESDADVHNLLDRIGDPAELAVEARTASARPPEPGTADSRIGLLEILALVLTPLIWPIGVVLLWTSARWNARDKLIATFVPPGGYPVIFLVFAVALWTGTSQGGNCTATADSLGNTTQSCSGLMALPGWEQALISVASVAGVVVLFLLPVAVGIYMARRLRQDLHPTDS